MKKKILFIMGAGGSGKTTNFNYLLSLYSDSLVYVPSYTTRALREGEVNGVRYHHISIPEFEEMIAHNEWLEYASAPGVHRGQYYGTRKSDIDHVCEQHKIPVKEVEVDGLAKIIHDFDQEYDIVSIFLNISDETMRERFAIRQTNMSGEDLENRIINTQRERDYAQQYCTYFIDASPALSVVQESLRMVMDDVLSK